MPSTPIEQYEHLIIKVIDRKVSYLCSSCNAELQAGAAYIQIITDEKEQVLTHDKMIPCPHCHETKVGGPILFETVEAAVEYARDLRGRFDRCELNHTDVRRFVPNGKQGATQTAH
jgi:DNA-directed RNA polymerase subunit RPC12/RpoP